jgi:RND family efflux transporter MFP subunit
MNSADQDNLKRVPDTETAAAGRSREMKNYRTAFLLTLTTTLVLAAALGVVWWRGKHSAMSNPASPAAETAPAPSEAQPNGNASAPAEAKLVPIQLSPARLQSIGVKTGEVQLKPMHKEIRTVGNVEVNERGLAYVQLRFPGWIQKVYVDSTYQYIRKGQPLFTIYSPDLVATEQEYLIARTNRNLLAQSTVPGVAAGADSVVNAAAARLKQWQVPAREIEQLEASGQVRQELQVDSPVSGYVIERNALPNQYVQPETRLYNVADLSTVWVYAQVFQNEIGEIKVGTPATVTTDAYPGRAFAGRVNYVWPQVDMNTRTVRVRLVFPNPGMKLTPGMFVNVKMDIPLGRHLAIVASGVFQSGARSIAFVDHGGGYLEPREVELGAQAGDEFIVSKGLKAGERIVTSANFLIDSESQLQAALGTFVPPPPGAGAAASMNRPAGEANIQIAFTTQPSPPHKGSNVLRVKLIDAGGAPLTGAQVSVRNFMPAMPQMGMAAKTGQVTLAEKGSGLYEGPGTLETGGTWQITITVMKNGQVIATKQTSVTAEGGM